MGLALLSGVVCVLFGTPVDNSIISGYFAPVWGYVKDSVLMLGVLILVLVCTRKRMYGLGGAWCGYRRGVRAVHHADGIHRGHADCGNAHWAGT